MAVEPGPIRPMQVPNAHPAATNSACGFASQHGKAGKAHVERGFTLIEMLVALAVFAIAALALVQMEGASIARTADLDGRLLREVVAQNMAAEILTDPSPPPVGEANGTIRNAGRQFAWTRVVALQPDYGVLGIRLSVREVTPGRESQAVTFDFTRLPGA